MRQRTAGSLPHPPHIHHHHCCHQCTFPPTPANRRHCAICDVACPSDADFLSHCAGAAHTRSVTEFQRGMAKGARVASEFTARVLAAPPPSNGVPPSRLPSPLSPAELATLTREQRFLFDIYNRESIIAQSHEMQRNTNSDEWESFISAICSGIATIRRYSQRVSYRTDFRVTAAAYLNRAAYLNATTQPTRSDRAGRATTSAASAPAAASSSGPGPVVDWSAVLEAEASDAGSDGDEYYGAGDDYYDDSW